MDPARGEQLMRLVDEVFPVERPPTRELITSHRCEECDDIARTFAPYSAADLPAEVIAAHYGSLCLLSASALAHYMPAYLRYAVSHFTDDEDPSSVVEFLVYQLCPEPLSHDGYEEHLRGTLEGFSERQGEALEAFLDLVQAEPGLPEFFGDWESHRARFRELWRTRGRA